MSIQLAEQLKREWTEKYVVVQNGIPELRRFDGLVGQVKTVNMNCRLLIEFDTPADISWYDIAPQYVKAVDKETAAQTKQGKAETAGDTSAKKSAATDSKAAAKPTAAPGGGSPLDKIRQQAAGGSGKAVADGGSPLDKIRKQAASSPSTESATSGSPLDQIRAQASSGPQASSNTSDVKADADSTSGQDSKSVPANTKATGGSPLDQIRAQSRKPAASETADESTTAVTPQEPAIANKDRSATTSTNASAEDGSDSENTGFPPAPAAPLDVDQTTSAGLMDSSTVASAIEQETDKPTSSASDLAEVTASNTDTSSPKPASSDQAGGNSSTPFDQIRQQSESDDGRPGNTGEPTETPIFDQVRRQAMADGAQEAATYSGGSDEAANETASNTPLKVNSLLSSTGSTQQELFDSSSSESGEETGSGDSGSETEKVSMDASPTSPAAAGGAPESDREIVGDEDPVNAKFRGKKLPKKDDLKIVEGIGPKIEQLFRDDGIQTWAQLSTAESSRLKKILEDAGPRFRMHNPETWPEQARMADNGEWKKLEEYQDLLDGGRPPEKS